VVWYTAVGDDDVCKRGRASVGRETVRELGQGRSHPGAGERHQQAAASQQTSAVRFGFKSSATEDGGASSQHPAASGGGCW